MTFDKVNLSVTPEKAVKRRKSIDRVIYDMATTQQRQLRAARRALKIAQGLIRDAGLDDTPAAIEFNRLCKEASRG